MAQEAKPTLSTRMGGFFGKIGKFFREVRAEFKRVQWPGRKDLVFDSSRASTCSS